MIKAFIQHAGYQTAAPPDGIWHHFLSDGWSKEHKGGKQICMLENSTVMKKYTSEPKPVIKLWSFAADGTMYWNNDIFIACPAAEGLRLEDTSGLSNEMPCSKQGQIEQAAHCLVWRLPQSHQHNLPWLRLHISISNTYSFFQIGSWPLSSSWILLLSLSTHHPDQSPCSHPTLLDS